MMNGNTTVDARPSGGPSCSVDSEPIPGTAPNYQTQRTNPSSQNGDAEVNVAGKYLEGDEYLMDHENRGKALIINNIKFQEGNYSDRTGSDIDAAAMYQRFQDLEFDTELMNDVSADDIMAKLKEIASDDHKHNDCFALVCLTHGDASGLMGTVGKFTETDMMAALNSKQCPSLAFKPKIFIFQACRGTGIDSGQRFRVEDDGNVMDAEGEVKEYEKHMKKLAEQEEYVKIPCDMNFLVCYASSDGKYANRNTDKGSPYIQALSKEMCDMNEDEDFVNVLTRVNRKVAYEFEHRSNTPHNTAFQGMKQMPCFISRLTKTLKFKAK